jgi:hypothetical protein
MWVLHLVYVWAAWDGEGELHSVDRYLSFPSEQACAIERDAWVERYFHDPNTRPPDVPRGYKLLMAPLPCEPASPAVS